MTVSCHRDFPPFQGGPFLHCSLVLGRDDTGVIVGTCLPMSTAGPHHLRLLCSIFQHLLRFDGPYSMVSSRNATWEIESSGS